jgi:hypothetical protein
MRMSATRKRRSIALTDFATRSYREERRLARDAFDRVTRHRLDDAAARVPLACMVAADAVGAREHTLRGFVRSVPGARVAELRSAC